MGKEPRSRKTPQPPVGKSNGASEAVSAAAATDNTDADYILINGPIYENIFSKIITEVHNTKKKRIVLTLVTYGGSANTAYRIGRFLQTMYDDISIFVPSICKSAGTLIACAGNNLIITPFGELGPLDVQLMKKDEIYESRSGLVTNFALKELKIQAYELFEHFMLEIKTRGEFVSFKLASDISSKLCAEIMKNVYQNVNLDALGDDMMNLKVAEEYGQRLNDKFNNLKDTALHSLVHSYPSHDFVIDHEEASKLFERVQAPDSILFDLLRDNQRDMMLPLRSDFLVRKMNPPLPQKLAEEKTDGTPSDAKNPGGSHAIGDTEHRAAAE